MHDITEAKIYVGTYDKYNNGSIQGDWLDLIDYDSFESFLEKCKEIHDDELEPVYMFQDYENIPKNFINESTIDKRIFELIEHASGLRGDEADAFNVFLDSDLFNKSDDAHDIINKFDDQYIGYFESEEKFGHYIFEIMGFKIEEFLERYIDYEKLGRDELKGGSFYDIDNYYFSCT